jgi:hypothetical protein
MKNSSLISNFSFKLQIKLGGNLLKILTSYNIAQRELKGTVKMSDELTRLRIQIKDLQTYGWTQKNCCSVRYFQKNDKPIFERPVYKLKNIYCS